MLKETMPPNTEVTEYKCPVCKSAMFSAPDQPGQLRQGGYTVWCGASWAVCSSQDVSGHGKNAKEANEIVIQKFVARKDR